MSRMKETVSAGNDPNHNLLHQFSFPSRRDYELRRFTSNASSSASSSSYNVVVAAGSVPNSQNPLARFQSQQQAAGGVHRESELAVLSMNPNTNAENLSFFSGSLRNVDYQSTIDNLRSGCYASSFHKRQWSEGSLPETPELGSSVDAGSCFRDRLQEGATYEYPSQSIQQPCSKEIPKKEHDGEPRADAHLQEDCKPRYIHRLRSCVSGELKFSSSVQTLERSSTAKARPWVSGELKSAVSPHPYRDDRVKSRGASAARVCTGLERASSCNLRGASGDNNRRPSAKIAWDSLNESREDSLMRESVAAVPFKWEVAPGKAHRTITAESGEQALPRKLSRMKTPPSSCFFEDVQRTATIDIRTELLQSGTGTGAQEICEEANDSGARDPDTAALAGANQARISGADRDRDPSSFRSSRRYYSCMSSRFADRSMSFGARSSNPDQLENDLAHIDLVAPAAARFLVESTSTVSPIPTPGKFALSVPFKWEEAPGKPKVDDTAAAVAAPETETSTTPPLQLPPGLLATVHKLGANTRNAAEVRSRYINQSMSAPFSIWYLPSDDQSAPACEQSSRLRSSSESHFPHSGPLERWRDVPKISSPLESAKRPSSRLQYPWRSAFCTMSGPILRSPHESLDLSDGSAQNSWHHPQEQHGHGLSGKNNPAWSPTSILCGPTSEDQRPPSILSLVSDVEVQHSSSTTASSILNSTSQYSSTSQESFEHSSSELIASPTSSLKTFLKKCRVKSQWPNPKSRRCITNAAGFDAHHLDLQLSMSPEPWCPAMDPCVQCHDVTEDTAAASEKTNVHHLKLHDHHEFPTTISLSPINDHTHDEECCHELQVARLGYCHQPVDTQMSYPVPNSAEKEQMVQEECTADEQTDFFGCLGFPLGLPFSPMGRMAMVTAGNGMEPSLWVNNPSENCTEDGYRSPAYTATLELFSPSADLMGRRRGSGLRMGSLKHPRSLLESMCNSFKHTVLSCAIGGSHRTSPIMRHNDHFVPTTDLQPCKF